MRGIICTNVRRQGDRITVMDLTNDELLFVEMATDEEIHAALDDDDETVESLRERFRVERTRRALGL